MNGRKKIGCTIDKQTWMSAADNLMQVAELICSEIEAQYHGNRRVEYAESLMTEFMLAKSAMYYVAEFATDKCRFLSMSDNL